MGQSWHNFFYGAFEPGGSVSVDKPPVDLWLQVASTKLFGFSSTSLRLPPALAGTLAVPLLYDTVRRLAGNVAGLAAAAALAVLPVAVLTARSDTMDSVLLALLVLAAWLTVLAAERGRAWPLLLAGAASDAAFNTKLFEALLPLPALALLYLIASEGSVRRRLMRLLAAAAVTVAVSMSWIVGVSLSAPPHPFPIGSTNGTVMNVVFKYNGSDRLKGSASGKPAAHATTGPQRLFERGPMRFGRLIGVELAAALMLGALAAIAALVRRAPGGRRRRAAAVGFGVWLITGAALFSQVTRLHPRYLEAMTAAVAAVLGLGLASLATAAPRSRVAALAYGAAIAGATYYAVHLSAPSAVTTRVAVIAAIAAVAACVVLLLPGVAWARRPAAGSALAAARPRRRAGRAVHDGARDRSLGRLRLRPAGRHPSASARSPERLPARAQRRRALRAGLGDGRRRRSPDRARRAPDRRADDAQRAAVHQPRAPGEPRRDRRGPLRDAAARPLHGALRRAHALRPRRPLGARPRDRRQRAPPGSGAGRSTGYRPRHATRAR